ncbi:MAG: hypothetical protein INR64_12990, partial [Caulobacteraceae bacterium]|nr:hypothetical protein [Caulobacter sp.]
MSHRVDTLMAPVERAAASIEQSFLAAGRGLGGGLETFEGISRELSSLLDTLQGGGVAEASTAIAGLAERLTALSHTLPRDVAALDALMAGNDGIAKHLGDLLEHIRMMTIIGSSARIEAAVFGEAAGLDSFTTEMSALTAAVSTAVGRCARDHAAMTGRVRRLHDIQSGLVRDFRERLLGLAQDLSATFAAIRERQNRSCALAEDLAGRSAGIAGRAGTALMALQSGDAARQRLEHVAAALRLAQDLAGSSADTGDRDAPAVVAALCALQAAQITDLVASFADEAGEIDRLLQQLGDDTGALVEGGSAVVGRSGSDGSFLGAFRARLADAAELVGTCDRARGAAAESMERLRTEVTDLSRMISDLGTTTRDLIVVGINAGLKAVRLGAGGRSLIVIAEELKRLAGLITDGSSKLTSAFAALVAQSRDLDPDARSGRAEVAGTDLLAIAAALEVGDRTMSSFVSDLGEKARHFDVEIARVRGQFRAA